MMQPPKTPPARPPKRASSIVGTKSVKSLTVAERGRWTTELRLAAHFRRPSHNIPTIPNWAGNAIHTSFVVVTHSEKVGSNLQASHAAISRGGIVNNMAATAITKAGNNNARRGR